MDTPELVHSRRAAAMLFVAALGVTACSRRQDETAHPAPAAAPESEAPSYGAVMADVARRFELVGKATRSGRWELARYEAGEIGELFDDTLPHASPPKEGHPEVLPALVQAFSRTTLHDLDGALAAHDAKAAEAAFARTASACNGCHHASGHGFIEVPTEPGRAVPVTDPAPAEGPSPDD